MRLVDDFDLSEHTALRTVFLGSNGSRPVQVMRDILCSVRSVQLEEILLQVPPWQLEDEAWQSLDELLCSSPVAVLAVASDSGECDSKIKSKLPACASRGTLQVTRQSSKTVSRYVNEVYGRMKVDWARFAVRLLMVCCRHFRSPGSKPGQKRGILAFSITVILTRRNHIETASKPWSRLF